MEVFQIESCILKNTNLGLLQIWGGKRGGAGKERRGMQGCLNSAIPVISFLPFH